MIRLHPLLLLTLTGTVAAFANLPEHAEDTQPLRVDAQLPAVELRTVDGAPVQLTEILGDTPSLLIFYRGGWCPYCNRHLASLMDIQDELAALGIKTVAISPDKPTGLREAAKQNKLRYTLLSDSEAAAAKAFGLAFKVDAATRTRYIEYGIDLQKASGSDHFLLPVPAVYLADASGTIRFAHANPDYKKRLAPEKILDAARSLGAND